MITTACKLRGGSCSRPLKSVVLLTTLLFAVPALGDVFVGARLGSMWVDTPSKTNPTNLAVNLGYEIDTLVADLSLVGEINRTVKSGKTNYGEGLEFEANSIYLIVKSTRALFTTFRAGIVQNETITGNVSRKGNGILIGASIGIVVGKTRLQIEYTSFAGDANYLALGLEF